MARIDPNVTWYKEHAGETFEIEIGGETFVVTVRGESDGS